MSLVPVDLFGRELDLAPPLVFGSLVLARRIAERLLTWRRERGVRSGRVSTSLLFVSYVGALAAALWGLGRWSPPLWAMAAGGAVWGLAVACRRWALGHVREQVSFWIEIRDGHRLVDTGPYALMRHPLHLAFALEVTAFAGLAWSAWAVAPAALVWIVVFTRNRTEEAALRAHFGGAWDEYAARVPGMNLARGLVRLVRRGSKAPAGER